MSALVLPVEERLARFRESTAELRRDLIRDLITRDMSRAQKREVHRYAVLPIGGGAPTLMTALTTLRASVTKNTFTGPATLLSDDARGPISSDWMNTPGAMWEQEGLGVVSSTVTPTIQFRTAIATTLGGSYTMVCQNPAAITTASGVVNADWYYFVIGRTVTPLGASSTMLCQGTFTSSIGSATNVQTAHPMLKNTTGTTVPGSVTVDFSTGVIFIDLQATWSASSVSNTVTTNFHAIRSFGNN